MNKLKKDDEVIVVAGKDKGKRGTISQLVGHDRVIVAGVNMVKRHERPMAALGRAGGIIEKEASVHVSNVALQTADGAATRVGYKFLDNGEKVRFAKKTGEQL